MRESGIETGRKLAGKRLKKNRKTEKEVKERERGIKRDGR